MLTSTASLPCLVAHTSLGPSFPQLLGFTWICHAVPLLLVTIGADLYRAMLPPTRRWDWDTAVFRFAVFALVIPFAIFTLASELHVPSIAGFFVHGLVLGVAVAIVCCIRCLGRANDRIRARLLFGVLCGFAFLIGMLDFADWWL